MCWSSRRGRNVRRCWSQAAKAESFTGNTRVYLDSVGVAKVPEDYEERLTEMFPGAYEHLRLCALDPYDLALSKLERNIQRDRDDVRHLASFVPLDLEILKERYGRELRWQLGNPEREELRLRLWIELKLWIEMIEEERIERSIRGSAPGEDRLATKVSPWWFLSLLSV